MSGRLQQERIRRRLSYRNLERELQLFDPTGPRIDFRTLHQFELGRRPWPAARRLLAQFFNITEAELFEEREQ
jgi:transcriptional regulator with XRE-family HTH domain